MVEEQLRGRDITDERVLAAMGRVPRHLFVPSAQRWSAYDDGPLPIGHGQTISQPYMVACMTERLRLTPTSKVLEVGTGSGYQAAVLAELVADVWTIERHPELARNAEELLLQLGYTNVRVIVGDGSLGFAADAPYDAILVTAAAPRVPEALLAQLAPGGRMIIPIRAGFADDLKLIERLPDTFVESAPEAAQTGPSGRKPSDAPPAPQPQYRETSVVGCTFVPLVGEQGYSG